MLQAQQEFVFYADDIGEGFLSLAPHRLKIPRQQTGYGPVNGSSIKAHTRVGGCKADGAGKEVLLIPTSSGAAPVIDTRSQPPGKSLRRKVTTVALVMAGEAIDAIGIKYDVLCQ